MIAVRDKAAVIDKLFQAAGFARFVVRRWTEDRCPQIAGSLAFTTLLALVPMFAIVVALLSTMPFFDEVMRQIKVFLRLNLAPEIAHKIITVYMEEIRQNAGSLSTAGVVLLFGTAMALMLTIDRSINAIWRVRRSRRWWVSILSYLLLLAMGPLLLVVSVSITTYFMVQLSPEGARAPWRLHGFIPQLAPMAASGAAFFLMYVFVPHRRVPWSHALAGGAVAAVLFELAKEGFAQYVHFAPTVSVVYGTFAAVPLFLLWLYLSWLVVLLGAELAASLDYWATGHWKGGDVAAAQVGDAISVARRLFAARGKAVSFGELQRETGLPAEHLEQAVMHLTADGLVKQVARDEYAILEGPPEAGPQAERPVRKGKRRRGRSGRSSP
jgi:membrane protein